MPKSIAIIGDRFMLPSVFAEHIRSLGGSVTADLYGAGTHNWPWWQRELHRSMPLLEQSLGAAPG